MFVLVQAVLSDGMMLKRDATGRVLPFKGLPRLVRHQPSTLGGGVVSYPRGGAVSYERGTPANLI